MNAPAAAIRNGDGNASAAADGTGGRAAGLIARTGRSAAFASSHAAGLAHRFFGTTTRSQTGRTAPTALSSRRAGTTRGRSAAASWLATAATRLPGTGTARAGARPPCPRGLTAGSRRPALLAGEHLGGQRVQRVRTALGRLAVEGRQALEGNVLPLRADRRHRHQPGRCLGVRRGDCRGDAAGRLRDLALQRQDLDQDPRPGPQHRAGERAVRLRHLGIGGYHPAYAQVDHYNGKTWRAVPFPASLGNPRYILAVSPHDVWLAGENNTAPYAHPVLGRWNGRTWHRVALPAPASSVLGTISADGHRGIWIEAQDTKRNRALLLHRSASGAWTTNTLRPASLVEDLGAAARHYLHVGSRRVRYRRWRYRGGLGLRPGRLAGSPAASDSPRRQQQLCVGRAPDVTHDFIRTLAIRSAGTENTMALTTFVIRLKTACAEHCSHGPG